MSKGKIHPIVCYYGTGGVGVGGRLIALLTHNLGARWMWVVNSTPLPVYPR